MIWFAWLILAFPSPVPGRDGAYGRNLPPIVANGDAIWENTSLLKGHSQLRTIGTKPWRT